MNVAQSGLSSIGLVLSASSAQNSEVNISSSELKTQAAQLIQTANNIALSLLSKKVPGLFKLQTGVLIKTVNYNYKIHLQLTYSTKSTGTDYLNFIENLYNIQAKKKILCLQVAQEYRSKRVYHRIMTKRQFTLQMLLLMVMRATVPLWFLEQTPFQFLHRMPISCIMDFQTRASLSLILQSANHFLIQ